MKNKKPYSVSPFISCINKNDRTCHCVGHLTLKKLDTNDILERKQMIENIEYALTEASKIISKTENLAVTEEANVDKAISLC